MILLIDNYDSFVYNLYQLIGTFTNNIKVIRNDELSIEEIEALQPSKIIISPGPGKPSNAGNIEEVVQYFYDKVPILGVCLGHQAICEAFGSSVVHALEVMHGKSSRIVVEQSSCLFKGVTNKSVARYHSLAVDETTLSKELEVIARSEEHEIMAIKHRKYPVYGVQFHPESILTSQGEKIMQNFLEENTND